jgi:hypothetical protein
MATPPRRCMARVKAASIATLLLVVLLSPFASGADSTVSVNTEWTGNVTLSGNVTVASGSTLTVSPGTSVDAGPYGIIVEGTLDADQAVFFSSVTPETQGSHGQGLWPGILVEASGSASLSSVTVANASASVMVKGTLTGNDVTFNDAYRGLSVLGGDANISNLEANRIDYEAVYVESGTLVLATALADEVAVGLANHGTSTVSDVTVREAGVGVQSFAGHLEVDGLGVFNASVGVAAVSGASTLVQSFTGSGLALVMDAGDADNLTVSQAQVSGGRLLVGQGVASVLIDRLAFVSENGNEPRAAVDVSCVGTCTLRESTLTSTPIGIAWSGSGTSVMDQVEVHALTLGVEATGAGHADWSNTSVTASLTGLAVQTPTSSLSNVAVGLTSSDSTGLDVLGGQHDWAGITVEKPFSSADQDSIGLRAWYADLSVDQFTSKNVSTGMLLEDSTVVVGSAETNIGSKAGIHLIDSDYSGQSLTTVAQDEGVLMEGEVQLHLNAWTAQLHDTPLMMSSGSEAVVRSFSPVNTAPASSDALGDGTLYYGSTSNPTVSTSVAYRLLETPVTFTDLQGNPVEADVAVHGFALKSNSNGALTLPLVSSGSTVDATLGGSGVRVVLYGGQNGQSVQVPVIPAGDWTVGSGQDIVLGPRPDGQPHQLAGDLEVTNNGRLTLMDTTLLLGTGNSVTLQGSGTLLGNNAHLAASSVQASGQSVLSGTGGSFTVTSDVQWGCLSERTAERLVLQGNLTVQPGCDISLTNGTVNGAITAQTGATFTSFSSLSVTVLDKGQPVSGALISIEGSVGVTDASGRLSTTTEARSVNDMGESYGGVKTVTLQQNNLMDFVTWDTNSSLTHTFMASSVPSGNFEGWLVLERQWSPYTLDGDLVLGIGSTMTVQDGVSLRISEASTITVNGLFDAGAATLSSTGFGARWGGLALGDSAGAVLNLEGTQVVESSPVLTVSGFGEVLVDGVLAARSASDPLLVIESGSQAQVEVRNSRLQDSGNGCVVAYPSEGLLTFTNVTFANCDGAAVWAQQAPLRFTNLAFEDGVDQALDFTGVTGTVDGLDATSFNGTGAIVTLNSLRNDFSLSNLVGVVTGDGGIVGQDNQALLLTEITLTGAPALDLDLTSGTLRDLTLTGDGTGTAVTAHHGRTSAGLVVENATVAQYGVGFSLHSDEGELSAPLIVRSSTVSAASALATENYPVRFEGTTLMGVLEVANTDVVAVDGLVQSVNADGEATFSLYRTMTLDAQRDGTPLRALYTVTYGDAAVPSFSVEGATVDVPLLLRSVSPTTDTTMPSWTVKAEAANSPANTVELTAPASADKHVVIVLQTNQPPEVTLVEPFPGQRVMEADSLRASATYSDDLDDLNDIVLAWKVYDMQGNPVLQGGNEPEFNITDLSAGFYVVEVTATDTLGQSATASTDFEYTQLDTDGDWSSTCSSETWFDPETGKSCGPDVYDQDDDNDGFSDAKDAFPLDPCAQVDTDGDTQPDVLDCPPGYTSWLTEDMDDDGDGTPDVLEGVTTDGDDLNVNALLVVLAVLVVVVLLFFARLRRGGPGDLSGLDQRHL